MKLATYLQFVGLFSVLLACGENEETRMQRFLIQGNEMIREREYDQAEKYFTSALNIDSCFADALNNLGNIEHYRQNYSKATAYYSRAIACNDSFYVAYLNRANVYFETGQPQKALRDLAVIETKIIDSLRFYELHSLVHWKLRNNATAISSFHKILRLEPGNKAALVNVGTLYTSERRFDSAGYYLEKAAGKYEEDGQVLNALAMLHAKKGEYDKANRSIDRALLAAPNDPYFLNNKGYILLQLDKPSEAIEFIDKSIVKDPYNAWAYRNKGIYFYSIRKYDDAVRLLERAREMDPLLEEVELWLGKSFLSAGKRTEACAALTVAIERKEMEEGQLPKACL